MKTISIALMHLLKTTHILLCIGTSVSYASVTGEINDYIINEIQTLKVKVVTNREAAIRIQIASSLPLKSAIVWNKQGDVIYPQKGLQGMPFDKNMINAQTRIRAQLISLDSLNSILWAMDDTAGNVVVACAKGEELDGCLLINTYALGQEFGLSQETTLQNINLINTNTNSQPLFKNSLWVLMFCCLLLVGHALRTKANKLKPSAIGEEKATSAVTQNPSIFMLGDMAVDTKRMRITRDNYQADISLRDLKLLRCFADHPDEVIPKDDLYTAGWGRNFVPNSRSLEQHIVTLRKKIDPTKNRPTLIITIHGQGYRHPKEIL